MTVSSIVSERNRERLADGRMRVVMGTVYSLFTFGLVFLPSYMLCYLLMLRGWAGLSALGVTAVFAAAATRAARRYVDPYAGKRGPTDAEELRHRIEEFAASQIGGGAQLALALRPTSITAFSQALISGPRAIIEGWRLLHNRVSEDPAFLNKAQALLGKCRSPLSLDRLAPSEECVLLLELGLVKVRPGPDGRPHLETTERGRAAMA